MSEDQEVMLHDESVGTGEDIFRPEGGKTYRFFLVPTIKPLSILEPDLKGLEKEIEDLKKKSDTTTDRLQLLQYMEEMKDRKNALEKARKTANGMNDAIKKGKARVYKRGDPGHCNIADKYILSPGLVVDYCYYRDGKGSIKAPPEGSDLRAKLDEAWEPARDWYGAVVVVFGLKMRDNEIIMTPDQDPKFDFIIQRARFSSVQASMLKKAMTSCSSLDRDLLLTTKKAPRGVKWESCSVAQETFMFNDDYISPAARLKVFMKAKALQAGLRRLLAKEYTEPELRAILAAKTDAGAAQGAAEAAEGVPTPQLESDLNSLLN